MVKKTKSPPRYRPSFTLIELLAAIGIIGTMAGMVLYALLGARTDARIARTRGTIQKINEVLLQRWEEYRYKPVNVQIPSLPTLPNGNYPVSPRETARVRMMVLRDTMRMEMPDRITDLLYAPSQYTVAYQTRTGAIDVAKIPRAMPPGFGLVYNKLRNTILNLQSRNVNPPTQPPWNNFGLTAIDSPAAAPYNTGVVPGAYPSPTTIDRFTTQTDADWNNAVQSSELLYLMVSTLQFGGSSALEYFRTSEVGDTDEDGLLEFVDAWGNAIHWIRWPAGYPGDLVRYADDDAMDPLKTDWRYRPLGGGAGGPIEAEWRPRTLVPLVLSAGPDEQFGVTFDFTTPIAYAAMTWPTGPTGPEPFGTVAFNPSTGATVTNPHYNAGAYFYPDPFFTWDFQNGGPNGSGSEMPYPAGASPRGYRANQIGSIPNYLDANGTIPNNVASDNVTNHDIILEP